MINKEDIRIRSKKANDILGIPPHFVIRSGIGLITLTLLLFLSTSIMIRYPEIVRTKIIITGGENPVSIIAEDAGKVEKIFVFEGEAVKKDQSLAFLTSGEDTSLIKAKISGKIAFYKLWSEKQSVSKGDVLMIINPEVSRLFGYAYVPAAGSKKLKEGQQVNIKLDKYPYEEFGIIKGILSSVSNCTKEDQYIIKISLSGGLTTSYGKILDYSPEMKGEAQIITENLTVFARIFRKMKKRFYQS